MLTNGFWNNTGNGVAAFYGHDVYGVGQVDCSDHVVTQPISVSSTPHGTAIFSIDLLSSTDPRGIRPTTLRWRKNGVPLTDGLTAHGSTVSGSGTLSISISNVGPLDAGQYDIEITTFCRPAFHSNQAALTLNCDSYLDSDLDNDCDVDEEDYLSWQGCVTGAAIPQVNEECFLADFDFDNDVDMDDFGILQRCISGSGQLADVDCED